MALDFIDSCAHSANSGSQIPPSRKWTSYGNVSYSQAQARKAGWSLAVNGSVSKTLAYKNERWFGCAYYFPVSSSYASNFMGFSSGGQLVAYITIESDLSLSIYSGGNNTRIWNSGAAHLYTTADRMHYYEFHCLIGGGTPITVTCGLSVDGQLWTSGQAGSCNFNASNLLINSAYMNQISIGAPTGGSYTGYACDIYCVNSDTTDINGHATTLNAFLGDVSIEVTLPITDQTVNWTPSSGSSHFTLVDEIPPDDDTTYVYSDTTSQNETFTFTQLIGFTGTLLGAQLLIYAKKDAEGSRAFVGEIGGTILTNLMGTTNYLYDYYDYFLFPLDTNNGTAWTPANFNSQTFGAELTV